VGRGVRRRRRRGGAPATTESGGSADPLGGGRWAGAVAGIIAGALALAVTELASGLVRRVPSVVGAAGQAVIDWTPGKLVHEGIQRLGHHDKPVLVTLVLVVLTVVAAGLGVASLRQRWKGRVGFVLFGVVGVVVAARDPQASLPEVLTTLVLAVAVGLVALEGLLRVAGAPSSVTATAAVGGQPSRIPLGGRSSPVRSSSRRAFLSSAAAGGILAAVVAATGRRLAGETAAGDRAGLVLPPVDVPVPAPTAANSIGVKGVSPVVVPNDTFYRIDDRLLGPPSVDVKTWRLKITGKVDRPQVFTWEELTAMPMMETYLTMQCVSNEVGGDLVGNASWRGVPLSDLLNRAGVHADADQIVGRAVDGFTVGFPTSTAFDGRHALVAVGMNDELLPAIHGFPARLVVAGLYGYVSATKWLNEIELTRFDAYDAYWVQRGWDQQAPIKTESRIDTIAPNPPKAGPSTLAGVAWAPTRGVSKVEVQVDSAPWATARLAKPLSKDTWVQWAFPWTATAGRHVIRVRATDGQGQTQTSVEAEPLPNAATGYHTVQVDIPA
jgi:DMSO/TMAO reductase YedYZ molybdopterin-dependent catalytic subunit